MKIPHDVRGRSSRRTSDSIKSDHARYYEAGSDLNKVNFFNNAIGTTILDIDLERVNH